MKINDFTSQSELIIDFIMQNLGLNREGAMKLWFNSKTYSEICRRQLFYISATRAYSELLMEMQYSDEWMRNSFDM